jgi:formate dehydrogenase major subunit
VWNFPDAVPQHREPLYSPRPGHGREVPDPRRQEDVLAAADAVQVDPGKNVADKVAEKFPLVLTSGRLVEYEGGGDETRSNPWLAELQQENFIEINPKDANDRGVKDGEYVWVQSPTGAQISVKALVTERVAPAPTFIPFHFAGWWQGKDMLEYYPKAPRPSRAARRSTPATTYGYDSVTMMQETKTTLCQVAKKA